MLTKTEASVLKLLSDGKNYTEISRTLGMSILAVDNAFCRATKKMKISEKAMTKEGILQLVEETRNSIERRLKTPTKEDLKQVSESKEEFKRNNFIPKLSKASKTKIATIKKMAKKIITQEWHKEYIRLISHYEQIMANSAMPHSFQSGTLSANPDNKDYMYGSGCGWNGGSVVLMADGTCHVGRRYGKSFSGGRPIEDEEKFLDDVIASFENSLIKSCFNRLERAKEGHVFPLQDFPSTKKGYPII